MPSLTLHVKLDFWFATGQEIDRFGEDTKGWGSGEICNERISPNSHINPTRISNTISF